jgi:hypothetical protein
MDKKRLGTCKDGLASSQKYVCVHLVQLLIYSICQKESCNNLMQQTWVCFFSKMLKLIETIASFEKLCGNCLRICEHSPTLCKLYLNKNCMLFAQPKENNLKRGASNLITMFADCRALLKGSFKSERF